MLSNFRVVLAGPRGFICIFDIPHKPLVQKSSHTYYLKPKWKYACDNTPRDLDFSCGSVFHHNNDHSPAIWILKEHKELHYIQVFAEEDPGKHLVKSHEIFAVNISQFPALGSSRAMWCSDTNQANTLTLSDSMESGSFAIPIEDNFRSLNVYSFDEVSGRVSFTLEDQLTKEIFVLVGDALAWRRLLNFSNLLNFICIPPVQVEDFKSFRAFLRNCIFMI